MNPFQLNKTEDDGTNLQVMTAREKEIDLGLKETGGERGEFFEAVVSKGTRRSLDTKAVKEHYGDELEPFYRETEVVTVKLNEIDSE